MTETGVLQQLEISGFLAAMIVGVALDSLSISQKAVYAKPFDTNIFTKHEGTYGVGW